MHVCIESTRGWHGGLRLEFRWTPSHEGICENLKVDLEVWSAMRGDSSPDSQLPKLCRGILPGGRLGAQQNHLKEVKGRAVESVARSLRCLRIREDPSVLALRFRKDTEELTHS